MVENHDLKGLESGGKLLETTYQKGVKLSKKASQPW